MSTIDETTYHQRIDALMSAWEAALDQADTDLDYEITGGILTVSSPTGKVIVSRQTPTREVWVAAKSGGYHFRETAGEWRDTRDGMPLQARLEALLRAIAGCSIRLS